jgi:hypothetical protein
MFCQTLPDECDMFAGGVSTLCERSRTPARLVYRRLILRRSCRTRCRFRAVLDGSRRIREADASYLTKLLPAGWTGDLAYPNIRPADSEDNLKKAAVTKDSSTVTTETADVRKMKIR